MKLRIHVETIPHAAQRYPTVGDWFHHFDEEGNFIEIYVLVSRFDDIKYTFLVAMHEIYEAFACYVDDIDAKTVTDFDMTYETRRKEGDFSEPGDSPDAPYKEQHKQATGLEKQMALNFGVDWTEYDKAVREL